MERDDAHRMTLSGDLSTAGVKEQLPLLVQHLDRLAESATIAPAQLPPQEIDLRGVQTLDACGCQLLVAFLRTLRVAGCGILSFTLNDTCREKIHQLGFASELLARECA